VLSIWHVGVAVPPFGFLVSTVAALTGVGGGIFIVPLLTLLTVLSPRRLLAHVWQSP